MTGDTQVVDTDDPDTDETQTDASTDQPADADAQEQPADATDTDTESDGFHCIAEQQALVEYFETFHTLLEELRLHIDEDGFRAVGVDAANVAFCRDTLAADAFEHYQSPGGLLGLDLERMLDVLSLGESESLVEIALDDETRKLHIQIDSVEFTLALIDPQSIRQEPELPDLDLTATATFEGRHLSRATTAAEMASDHVRFRTGEDDAGTRSLLIEANGDTDDVQLALREGGELIDFDDGDANSLFSLDYLDDMVSVVPDDAAVTLRIGEEFPFELAYDHIEVGDETHGEALFMLAPRVESD